MDSAHLRVPQLRLDVTVREDGKAGSGRCPPEALYSTGERRPLASRIWSSPPASPLFQQFSEQFSDKSNRSHGVFTPPETPVQHRRRASFAAANGYGGSETASLNDSLDLFSSKEWSSNGSAVGVVLSPDQTPDPETRVKKAWESSQQPRLCAEEYEVRVDESSEAEEFGRGAWSIVYKAEGRTRASKFQPSVSSMLSPPESPTGQIAGCDEDFPKLVAIKAPGRRDGKPILEQEARILTYLQPLSPSSAGYAEKFMTKFFGFDTGRSALVLEAAPLTMLEYCEQQAKASREQARRERNMKPRVAVGMDMWLELAQQLIGGLKFFHDQSVVHGDIKPMNILLREGNGLHGLQPIFCDFSSSHVVHPEIEPEKTTAWTTEFTAPEVLKSCARGEDVVATFANDIFALGVSLLTPVTGTSPYAGASVFQKRSMAMQGTPLIFELPRPRDRTPDFIMIDRLLSVAVHRDVAQRSEASAWQNLQVQISREWHDFKSAN